MSTGRDRSMHRPSHSVLAYALACLIDPPTLVAIGLLLLNDHVLKATVPSWWTGKLSDLAGLYFFPALLLALLSPVEVLLGRVRRSPGRANRLLALVLVLSGLWFVALKATPVSNAWAVAVLKAVTGRTYFVVADLTDLIALAMLPLAWYRWRALLRRDYAATTSRHALPGRNGMGAGWRRWFGFAVLVVGSLATIATSPPYIPFSFGIVFDVAADPVQGDTLYASLATRRILKCRETEGPQLLGADCWPEDVSETVETYRSQDGGHTWAHYSEVGGYLWADPHATDRLYVLNEGGWHRMEGGQVRSFDIPLTDTVTYLISQDHQAINVLSNVHPVAFDPVTPGVLYMVDDVSILVSTDGGETWTSRPAAPESTRIMALSVAPSAPQTLYAADSNYVSRSDDGGRSWVHRTPVGEKAWILALAVHPATPEIVYAAGSGVWLSVDSGQTWENIYLGRGIKGLVLHPADPDLIYATGRAISLGQGETYKSAGVVVSDDGGKTWQDVRDPLGGDIAISPADPHHVILALEEKGTAIWDPDASGQDPPNWQQSSEGLPVFVKEH